MKTKTPPKLRKEMKALRSIVPNTSQKTDLDVILHAISYIKNLEAKLTHPQDLLKAQFIAQHRMNLQKCEAWTKPEHSFREKAYWLYMQTTHESINFTIFAICFVTTYFFR